ncbi:phage portal protein [Amycolatopsis kentuckyensis]|uniref:phage portal protein n=1 Tax=Amycolatopsis kentuckyensis TaxID=218823 RepID=UPI003569952B
MDANIARTYLMAGLNEIEKKQADWTRRENYRKGVQDLPYAPQGVNDEYMALREQAIANVLDIAMGAPVQRLRAEGFRTGRKGDADQAAWDEVWQPNKLDARQAIVYTEMVTHGRGVMSVWPNTKNPKTPYIRVESSRRVHIGMDPEDPFTPLYAVKTFTVQDVTTNALILPGGYSGTREVAVVYDSSTWVRFEKGGRTGWGVWTIVDSGTHPLGAVPFVPFDNKPDGDGVPFPAIVPLMPQQDALNTIRFNTLLAMQFSAYRQRVFTGYDPVLRDNAGNVIYQKNTDGSFVLDTNGQKKPALSSPGRVGVDRALVFPGKDTKVFDLPESNLQNYITVLGDFMTTLFATGQIPPQYLLNRLANLSGDALAAAESTLASLVDDLKRSCGESLEQVMRLANRARGENEPDLSSEVIWADAEARSFAQIVDAITKLIGQGFPREGAFEMLPGATPQKVSRWMDMVRAEEQDPYLQSLDAKDNPPVPQLPPAGG